MADRSPFAHGFKARTQRMALAQREALGVLPRDVDQAADRGLVADR